MQPILTVGFHQLSDIERDALNHYPGTVSPRLFEKFRGAVMVFAPLLPGLWRKGLRIRIVPYGKKFTNLTECFDLKRYTLTDGRPAVDVLAAAMYMPADKFIVIPEKILLHRTKVNQRLREFIHEFAHAIWHLLLEEHERAEIRNIWRQERNRWNGSSEFRLYNEREFWAEGFRYYFTPEKFGPFLVVDSRSRRIVPGFGREPGKLTLKYLNIKLHDLIERKFKGLISPDMVADQMMNADDEMAWEINPRTGLYDQVINVYL